MYEKTAFAPARGGNGIRPFRLRGAGGGHGQHRDMARQGGRRSGGAAELPERGAARAGHHAREKDEPDRLAQAGGQRPLQRAGHVHLCPRQDRSIRYNWHFRANGKYY